MAESGGIHVRAFEEFEHVVPWRCGDQELDLIGPTDPGDVDDLGLVQQAVRPRVSVAWVVGRWAVVVEVDGIDRVVGDRVAANRYRPRSRREKADAVAAVVDDRVVADDQRFTHERDVDAIVEIACGRPVGLLADVVAFDDHVRARTLDLNAIVGGADNRVARADHANGDVT